MYIFNFRRDLRECSQMALLFYSPSLKIGAFHSLHILTSIRSSESFGFSHSHWPEVVTQRGLMCISLMTADGPPFTCLWSVCVSYFVRQPFKLFSNLS